MSIKRIVLDILVPHEPDVLTFADRISGLDNIDGVYISVIEQDEQTKTIEMTIEGEAIEYDQVKAVIEDLGASVHSIDEVAAGSKVIERNKAQKEGA